MLYITWTVHFLSLYASLPFSTVEKDEKQYVNKTQQNWGYFPSQLKVDDGKYFEKLMFGALQHSKGATFSKTKHRTGNKGKFWACR